MMSAGLVNSDNIVSPVSASEFKRCVERVIPLASIPMLVRAVLTE